MAEITSKKLECKAKVNSTNGIVFLDCETKVVFNVKNSEVQHSINLIKEVGILETIRHELIKEQINVIAMEMDKRIEQIKRGFEELEKTGLMIEVD
ncbi:SIFV.gp20-like protein [Sulfolobus islandicus filamentous virus 2]|uniref:SIFV.gp20-like protein n=1 Tax=Sulfolobus islandicus filamentous virus 2 TaxID=1902331 RepID=A0A1D8BJ82_SIFV|nr:SIFV.gp20-like protein [Sulfolobus islandicus filamentous virus 2]